MGNIGLGFRVGAVLVGVGFAFSLALPVAAQETASAQSPGSDQRAVADSTQSFIETVGAQTPTEAFADAFIGCINEASISDCTEQALQNAGVEEPGGAVIDLTPLNPNDTAADVPAPGAPLDVAPPGTPVE